MHIYIRTTKLLYNGVSIKIFQRRKFASCVCLVNRRATLNTQCAFESRQERSRSRLREKSIGVHEYLFLCALGRTVENIVRKLASLRQALANNRQRVSGTDV